MLIELVGPNQSVIALRPDPVTGEITPILPKEEVQRLIEEVVLGPEEYTMEMYLESDTHLRLVQYRIDAVLEKYPHINFNSYDMEKTANTREDVREKFEKLRDLNIDLEDKRKANAITPARGRNDHISELLSFMLAYIYALRQDKEDIEYKLILELQSILNDEYGNLTSISDVPEIFVEGVEKGVSGITSLVGKGVSAVFGGLAEGLLGSDWQKKLIIILGVVGVVGVGGLVSYSYAKSYVKKKAEKRAEK